MRSLLSRVVIVLVLALAIGPAGQGAPPAGRETPIDALVRHPAPARLVAFGDIHGDFGALQRVLRLAGVTDAEDHWIGGTLWVVHTGDYLDRGDGELKIMQLLSKLKEEAALAGGRMIVLNANHEIINVDWVFRFVTDRGFASFDGMKGLGLTNPKVAAVLEHKRSRAAAFLPGGPMATRLAENPIYAIVGDTVFVHGGFSPAHVKYGIERINREMRDWMLGKAEACPQVLKGSKAPVWMRDYSRVDGPADCEMLSQTLTLLGVKRMVVGHTVQAHVNAACDGRIWRIDTGMSAHYGGPVEALEITSDGFRAIRERIDQQQGE